MLLKLEKLGRLVKWTVELGEHEIDFKPWTSIKAHALADFIIEITNNGEVSAIAEASIKSKGITHASGYEWILHTC